MIAQVDTLKIAEHASTMTEPALLLAALVAVVACFGVVVRFLVNAFLQEHARLVEQNAELVQQSRIEREDCTNKREALHAERKVEVAQMAKWIEQSENSRARIVQALSAQSDQMLEIGQLLVLVKDRLDKSDA